MENTTNTTFNSTTNSTYTAFTPPVHKPFITLSGLVLPVAYLVVLIGSLYSFSKVYRQRQLARQAKLAPWFASHKSRDIYLTLLHLDPDDANDGEKKLGKVPESILRAALLQRALEDIQRIVQLRMAKPALQTLLQRGSVGEELWLRFQRAEQEMEAEVKEVVEEANAFVAGWGQVIFQSANEMNQNLLLKERTAELLAKVDDEKAWWDNKRKGIQSEFLKENGIEGDALAAEPPAKRVETRSSDEDAVIVESGGPAQAQGSGKKKGKK